MNKTSIIQTGKVTIAALAATTIFAGIAAKAQTVFSENFNPISSSGHVQDGYSFGDTTSSSSGIVAGAGLGGTTPGWQTVDTAASGANGFSGVGGQYQNQTITTATDPNLSDYTLSFYAMESSSGGTVPNLSIVIQTWTGEFFGGTMTGTLTAGANGVGTISLNPTYTLYTLNLGNASVFQTKTAGFSPAGETYQIAMQLNGGGTTPYTDTLDVDDFQLRGSGAFILCFMESGRRDGCPVPAFAESPESLLKRTGVFRIRTCNCGGVNAFAYPSALFQLRRDLFSQLGCLTNGALHFHATDHFVGK